MHFLRCLSSRESASLETLGVSWITRDPTTVPELLEVGHRLAAAHDVDELGAVALGHLDELAPKHAAGGVVQQPLVGRHAQVLQKPDCMAHVHWGLDSVLFLGMDFSGHVAVCDARKSRDAIHLGQLKQQGLGNLLPLPVYFCTCLNCVGLSNFLSGTCVSTVWE